jgi:DNA repair photolyase
VFVRWDDLLVSADEQAQLPGYRESAVVRRFDAPEALDTRFYEVRARSALNRVPRASRMPFKWTVNPYRGCSHACVYCAAGDTPILMADGRTKPLADLRRGDRVYGTVKDGAYRRYVATEVLDHWSTIKPAYRVTLEDGTELVASGDHRFLAQRGWKHVTGAMGGPAQRPYLTTNDRLLGTGRFAVPPEQCDAYRRGYLCGMIRGDGHVGSYEYDRPGRARGEVHRFRLALADDEALQRSRAYLAEAAVSTDEFAFHAGTDRQRAIRAIRTQRRDDVEQIRALIAWPLDPDDGWRKGFLAGIFDAEGSCGREAWRVPNTDPLVISWLTTCLDHFGFRYAIEDPRRANGIRTVRLRGGLAERLRFFHLTDPAITRKRTIDGTALKAGGSRRVVSVEPLGMTMRLYDITTGTGDFIANGIVSHNCFARPTHRYLDFDAGRDFEREIVVKVNAPEVLRAELARPSWRGEHVAMGTNTDPYQWVEGRYRLMEGIWEALRDARNPCSILTKSPLLLRDLPLMREIAAVTDISAALSVPTIDERAWRATEPHTPSPRARLEAVGELNRAGIPCGILVAPLMPGINDDPAQVEEILALAAANGATGAGGIALHLRGDVRGVFMDWLRSQRPDLVPRYEQLYARGAYAPKAERDRLGGILRAARRQHPLRGARSGMFRRQDGDSPPLDPPTARPRRPAPAVQEALF